MYRYFAHFAENTDLSPQRDTSVFHLVGVYLYTDVSAFSNCHITTAHQTYLVSTHHKGAFRLDAAHILIGTSAFSSSQDMIVD